MPIAPSSSQASIAKSIDSLRDRLRSLQNGSGYWTGRLSTSALSTATAISALTLFRKGSTGGTVAPSLDLLIDRGVEWLLQAQNDDGGFGDTERSHSNIATTYLAIAALTLADRGADAATVLARAQQFVQKEGGWEGLRRRYGKDKTFVVPIMTNCALAGLVDWSEIPPLPFEAAALPQSWYRFAKMPVVSYAIPALVAIGQAHYHFAPPRNPILRGIRWLVLQRTYNVLRRMQPQSGGYLEAVPLTSFVLMSLASIGQAQSEVAVQAFRFLEDSILEDGSWPIDTNLATWVTSLTTRAALLDPKREAEDPLITVPTIQWLLECQHRVRHPFTGADPGGWGWTNLTGAVPDADDTPAALLALRAWKRTQDSISGTTISERIDTACASGIHWLLGLQNRDGGWPTFCRGWGTLPFDRSGSDLTAHAMRALLAWYDEPCAAKFRRPIDRALLLGLRYLEREQREDGSWLPLWFGNQDDPQEENPIYGTSRVLVGLADLRRSLADLSPSSLRQRDSSRIDAMIRAGVQYLERSQNPDGGWGGGNSLDYRYEISRKSGPRDKAGEKTVQSGNLEESIYDTPRTRFFTPSDSSSSIEETALAIEAILCCDTQQGTSGFIMRGIQFLEKANELGWSEVSWPIGFYFAKLWYHEQMYPIIFSLVAFSTFSDALRRQDI